MCSEGLKERLESGVIRWRILHLVVEVRLLNRG